MILGGHEAILSYPTEKYPFQAAMQRVLGAAEGFDLRQAHTLVDGSEEWAPLRFEEDTSTEFHKRYYKSAVYGEIVTLYRRFLREWFLPTIHRYGEETEYIVQAEPSFRIHLPNNTALGATTAGAATEQIGLHCDSDYNHPSSEMNYILTITGQSGTNSCYVETEAGKEDFHSVDIAYGELFRFYGNRCRHYNRINRTGETRISLDFRVIPGSKWPAVAAEAKPDAVAAAVETKAVHSGRPFSTVPGGYYTCISLAE